MATYSITGNIKISGDPNDRLWFSDIKLTDTIRVSYPEIGIIC